jgi:hypothetical protein
VSIGTVLIYKDELYPYYGLSKSTKEANAYLTDKERDWVESTLVDFEKVQELLEEKYNEWRE